MVDAGLRGLERNQAVIVPGWRNRLGARAVQLLPRRVVTGMAVRLLAPAGSVQPRPPIDVTNEVRINADAEQIWRVLTTVDQWPTWYEACRWVRRDQPGNHPVQPGAMFAWKAHPVALRSTVLQADAQRTFSFRADGRGLSAIHTFTLHPEADGAGVRVVSHETQTGPLPRLGHRMLAGVLRTSNQTMLTDLARNAEQPRANARRVPAQ